MNHLSTFHIPFSSNKTLWYEALGWKNTQTHT
jgi:hypothetical protein